MNKLSGDSCPIRHAYRKLSIPPLLVEHLVMALRQNSDFKDWPLETIVPNSAAFWEFLNERWPVYVRQSKGGTMMIQDKPLDLKYPGPAVLPFGHDAVRVHIDNLFEDGILTPVEWDWSQSLDQKWIRVGLLGNKVENADLRFEELGKNLLKDCPDKSATPQSWLAFANRYAQARMLWTQISVAKHTEFQKQLPTTGTARLLDLLDLHVPDDFINPTSATGGWDGLGVLSLLGF